jgi:hypothetical protein
MAGKKVTLPKGATPVRKNLAAGDELDEAVSKATNGKVKQPPRNTRR